VLVSCLLVAPLLSGPSAELFSRLGWMLLEGLGLALLPLVANVAVGAHAILTRRYRTGEFLRLRDGGEGSVAGLDLLSVRLLDSRGEQVLVPHLLAMVQPLRRLPTTPGLEVELPVPVELGPQLALQLLEQTAADFVAARCPAARAVVSVLEVGERHCRVRVSLPSCPQTLRSDLLLALWGALPAAGAQTARTQARPA
jgi:small-conductance mechanosensitive channel